MPFPVRQAIHQVSQVALDALFPPRCAGCRAFGEGLFCTACEATLLPLEPPFCLYCGLPLESGGRCRECRRQTPDYAALRSAYVFEGAMRDAIHRLKYNGKTALGPALAATLYSALRQQDAGVRLPLERITLIVPVPLHGWRRWRRGYNQSELLAQALWTCWRTDMATVEYCADLLQRTQYTTPQVELDEQHRAANVRDAFKVRPERLKQFNLTSLPILLIDDVCTTGATLNECARVLREAGASEIYAATLARGI